MDIEIPSEVTFFLNICGVPYPDISEDAVRALARHVRTFATQVQDTHGSATRVIEDMGSVYSGYSYEQLVASWSSMSSAHMHRLEAACTVVEKALYAAATVITVVKVAVLAELAALAAAYASIMVTPPLAPAAPTVVAAARRLCAQMQQSLIAYIVAEVIGKAIEPLEQAVDDMIKGIVYDATRHALGIPVPTNSTQPLRIDPDAVERYAEVLDDHADDIMQHAATFAENVSLLEFATPTRFDEVDTAAPPQETMPVALARMPDGAAGAPSEQRILPDSATGAASAERPAAVPAETHGARTPFAGGEPALAVAGDRPGSAIETGDGQTADDGEPGRPAVGADRISSPAGSPERGRDDLDPTARPSGAVPAAAHGERSEPVVAPGSQSVDEPNAQRGSVSAPYGEVLGETVHSVIDSEVQRPSGVSGPGIAVTSSSAVHDAAASQPVGSPIPQLDNARAAVTPWGRAGHRSSTPKALPPKPTDPSDARSTVVRGSVVTPWTKTRHTRETPVVAHAPSATRPSLRLLRERRADRRGEGPVETSGPAGGLVVPSRVTAPPPESGEPPIGRA